MDERLLQAFVEVAEHRNLTAAALRVGLTQPALTRQIQRLETSLGVQLLTRHKRGVELTEMGQLFHQRACELLRRIEETREEIVSLSGEPSGGVTVAAPPSLGMALFARIALRTSQRFPQIALNFSEGMSRRVDDDLLGGTTDVGLISTDRVNPGTTVEPLFAEPLYLLSGHQPGDKRDDECELRDIAGLPLVIAASPNGLTAAVMAAAARQHVKLDVRIKADSIYPAFGLIDTHLYHAVLPRSAIADGLLGRRMTARRIRGLTLDRYLAYTLRRPPRRAVGAMIGLVRDVARDWGRANDCRIAGA